MARRRAQASCVLASLALTACGHRVVGGWAIPEPTNTPGEQPGWVTTTLTNTGSPVTINHPRTWRFVKSDAVYLGDSSVVGYFTNAPTVQQCHAKHIKGGEQIDCNGPVPRLDAGQVLITVTAAEWFVADSSLKTNAVLDGRPAAISAISDPQESCPPGAGAGQDLSVGLNRVPPADPRGRWRLFITACEGRWGDIPNGSAPTKDAETVLRTITFPLATR